MEAGWKLAHSRRICLSGTVSFLLACFTIGTSRAVHPSAQAYGVGPSGEGDVATHVSFLEEFQGAVRAAVPFGPRLLFVEDALAVRGFTRCLFVQIEGSAITHR